MKRLPIYFLYATIAFGLTIIHHYNIDARYLGDQITLHNQILSNSAPQPYNIRLLQPWIVQAFTQIAAHFNIKHDDSFTLGYSAIRFLSIFSLFCFAEVIFAFFGGLVFARFAVLYIAAIFPLSFLFYFYQPTSVLDIALFALAVLLIIKNGNFPLLAAVLLVATMNRNTSIFICIFYALWNIDDIKSLSTIFRILLLFILWAAVIFMLKRAYPSTEWIGTVSTYVHYNLSRPRVWILSFMMLWPIALSFIIGWKELLLKHKLLLIFCLIYAALHFVMSQADEVRYWLPLYIATAPALASAYLKLKNN